MGKFQPLPIVGGAYTDDTRPYSVQDTVNFLPVKAEAPGMRSDGMLKQVPGLIPYCGTNSRPIRGAYVAEGRHFVVAGTTLYSINAATHAATSLGTVPGSGRVSFAHNQVTGGNQVIVVNGSQGFVWNTVTGTFSQITDVDFPGSIVARYLGQYLIGIEPKRRYWFHSDLATATTYLSTDTYEAESSPDLLVGLEVSQGRLLVLGTRTIEEWVNDPTESSAFQRSSVIERGAASTHANVVMDNSLIWLGDDGIVYRLNGYTPTRISNHAIERDILDTGSLSNAFAFGWEDRGHKVYYLTLPNGHTWGYDIASGLWHRRQSYRLDRWRANSMVLWNGDWYAGDYSSGVIYKLAWLAATECCDPLVRERTLPVLHDNENRLCVDAVALVVDVGREDATITHAAPTVTGALPDYVVGDAVSYQYTLGAAYPGEVVTAAITAGALPTGLSMSSAGLVTGTASTAGSFTWTVTATNACGDTGALNDAASVTVLTLAGDVPNGVVGQPISGTYSHTGGIGAVTYAVSSGTFPAGLTLNANGTYSGSYTTAQTVSWVITGTDSLGHTATINDSASIVTTGTFDLNAVTDAGTTHAGLGFLLSGLNTANTVTITMPSARLYTAIYYGAGTGDRYGNQLTVTTGAGDTTYIPGNHPTAADSYTAAQTVLPLVLTGHTSYQFWIYDTPVSDNTGGLSCSYTITP